MAILKRRWEAGVVIIAAALMLCSAAARADVINVPTTFAVADASDGTVDNVYNVAGDLTITSTGSITCNDSGASGASACPITIVVTGKLVMEAGSAITAENTNDGGSGGDITITVGTSMTMCGPAGAQPDCGGASANDGALISSRKTSGAGDTGVGGDIVITVGDVSTATGAFYMEGGTTGYGTETGATVISTGTGPSGDITITAGATYFSEPGSVVEAGDGNGTAVQQGGKIFLVSDCDLTSEGRVTSKGPDFGADLVHLEACTVLVRGLVESTGKGHAENAPNSCDLIDDGLDGEVLRDHPANSTGCVEVWGNFITIDSLPPWAGELNADIGDGGAGGTSWIDIFALSNLTVTDGTGNDFERDNKGHTYFSVYAVHANAVDGSDDTPAVVTALVKNGPLTASGKAFEASSTMTADTGHGTSDPFVGNGSTGGTIRLEASGTVTLDTAWVNASGDFFGGTPCPSGSGACGHGGHIIVKAWGAGSDVLWRTVSGDVRPNPDGDIILRACDTIDTTGTDFHGEVPDTDTGGANCDPTQPTIPTITAANAGPVFKTNLWALCGGGTTVSGIKFNDINGNGVQDPGDVGLPGWTIHIFGTTLASHTTAVTGAGGAWSVPGLAPGSYTVCEQLQVASPPWQQTFPTSGTDCSAAVDPAGDNPTPGKWGYTIEVTAGTNCAGQSITGLNFGNRQVTVTCPEDPNRAAQLTRTVKPSEPLGGGGVPGNPANYATVQAAYDAAKVSAQAEVIGLFSNTTENLSLDGSKSLTITQCTNARVTAASAAPVWNITSTGKLTIIGPDSVGGTIGWRVAGNGGHNLKSVRANGASQYGILIESNGNSVSWNDVSGNGPGAGIRVTGGSNILKGGTVGPNNGDGVQLIGNSNTLSGATIQSNTGNGVLVAGSSNQVKSNSRVNLNGLDGILVTGSSNTLSSNASESGKGNAQNGISVTGNTNQLTDNKMNTNAVGFRIFGTGNKLKSNNTSNNTGNEYEIGAGQVDQGSNKKNGSSFTFTNAGGNFN